MKFELWVEFDHADQHNTHTPTYKHKKTNLNQGVLHPWFKFGGPDLNRSQVIALTNLGLIHTQWHTIRQLYAGKDNTPRPNLAMGKKIISHKCISGPGLGSNTFYQIQIQIQKFGFFKYKYKYKYFVQHWFKYKYKYKYIDSNTNTNTFNQIYLLKLFWSKIGQFCESQDIWSWPVFP